MSIKTIAFLFVSFVASEMLLGQNDFGIRWSVYESGDIVEDNPFLGSFTIKNEGESTIMANDTVWYGYWIEGLPYDLGINPDLVSGRVLESDFLPGDEITVTNNFDWPLLGSGITVEICAVVYGAGIASFESLYFLGDDSIENNLDCIFAVLPTYTVSIDMDVVANERRFSCYFNNDYFIINQQSTEPVESASIFVTALNGEVICAIESNLIQGNNGISLPNLSKGLYLISIVIAENRFDYKVIR